MEINDKEFSPEDSLLVIRSMIESTRNSIGDRSHYFLLWGWTTMIACISQYLLLVVFESPYHFFAWLVTPVALILHIYLIIQDKKQEQVKTFISEANEYVWIIIGISFMALNFVFIKTGWQYSFPIYIMLYGIGTYITGSLLKFKPLQIGGIICLFLVALTPYLNFGFQILSAALAILVSYIIPGHLLKNQYSKHKKYSNGQ